jgi:hypothetical protein
LLAPTPLRPLWRPQHYLAFTAGHFAGRRRVRAAPYDDLRYCVWLCGVQPALQLDSQTFGWVFDQSLR